MTRDQKTYRMAYWLASYIIGAVLLSGYQKIFHPADFALSVYRFHLLPDFAVNLTALYITWLETLCGICLLAVPKFRVAALWIALFLFVAFTGGIAVNLLRGSAFGCGCFGGSSLDQPMDWLSLARSTALIALVLLAISGKKKSAV